MKKLVSVILAILMILSLALPASAISLRTDGSDIPVVSIFGDGEALYDTEGNMVFKFSEILNMLGGSEDGAAMEAVINILQPFLIEGIVQDEWDNYYDALEKEIGELFAEVRYDKNGENCNGTDVSKAVRQKMADNVKRDTKKLNGSYYVYDYQFWYDWRQDPLKTADEFHQYIQDIKAITGAPKVSIIARCLGTSVVMAYLAKYGTDDVHGVSFNGSIAAGGEIISETISGKFNIDLNAINRLLADFESLGSMNIDAFITSSIDLAAKSGKVAGFEFEETEIYAKLAQGVTSALALSTFFTWPGYWALVTDEDYENALLYVFGEEGSAKRQEYAKLIEKIQNYHDLVVENLWNIMSKLKDDEIKVGVIAKYGFQLAPICQSNDLIADQYATIKNSSFGATTSTVYDTLSDEYIAQREAEGKGKYISPDKQIDASTCFFPDSTWFTKGISHSDWTQFETALLFQVITADKQLTIDDFDCTQFVIYDKETNMVIPMTEENCHIEAWTPKETQDKPESIFEKLISWLTSLFKWFTALFGFVSK